MTGKKMKECVKDYAELKLDQAQKFCETKEEVDQMRKMALGAVQFTSDCYPEEFGELQEWWWNFNREFDKVAESKRVS